MKKFSNNSEQKIILCRTLEIVYGENSKQFLWENSEQFYLTLKKDFLNAVSRFEYIITVGSTFGMFFTVGANEPKPIGPDTINLVEKMGSRTKL